MSNLLGLSIDVGSLGWTLIDNDSMKIKAMGTYVFPIGSENYGSGIREVSKRSIRTQNRIKRLRYSRKRMRKKFLIKLLVKFNMCPIKESDIQGGTFASYFENKDFNDWMKLNPYELRTKALREKISLHELGRIFYHMSKRRGFSFGKRDVDIKTNMLYKGIPNSNRTGIIELKNKIKKKTLGEYFNSILPKENISYQSSDVKVRNRFVDREMYVSEAHQLWNKQTAYYPELTNDIRDKLIGSPSNNSLIKGAVFYQKPLRSQKHKVGKCAFESSKSRCSVSNLVYQDFLAYKWIDTIKKEGKKLSQNEREKIYFFFMTNSKFNFEEIRELLDAKTSNFNKKDNDVIYGSRLNSRLSDGDIFGMDWFSMPFSKRKEIWDALYFFNSHEKLENHARQKWGMDVHKARAISSVSVDKRYAPISEKAAKNILFFLKRGVSYELSVVLAGVKNSLNNVWSNIEENDIQFIINRVVNLYRENIHGGFIPALQEFLIDEMQFSDFQIKKLYGVQAQTIDVSINKKFPYGVKEDKEIIDFKNPLLKNALFQTRKVVNNLVDKYGAIDEIKAELNTNLKTNKFQRFIYLLDQRRVARNRGRYINKIGSISENLTQLNLLKMELWEECKGTCPFTGDHIPMGLLFTDKIKVVYIHPWSVSLNDSPLNKTLCFSHFSDNLDQKSPYSYFNEEAPHQWEEVLQRAKKLFSNTYDYPSNHKKFRKFAKRYYRRKYINNQLDDPNFISREVACFLSKISLKVSVSSDYTSDHFIRALSLDNIIDTSSEKFKYKDHRNYALKSYVAAIRSIDYLKELAARNKYTYGIEQPPFPVPHSEFRNELKYFLNSMLVSHKKSDLFYSTRRVDYKKKNFTISQRSFSPRGSLHKDSIYGKRTSPNEKPAYHIRKPLESIRTVTQIEKIVDANVRNAVFKVLKKAHLSNRDSFVPHKVFFRTKADGRKTTKVFLPNKNGDPVPVNKVRIRESLNSAVKLKNDIDQYVNLRNNHHVLIYKNEENILKEKVVSFWEFIKRIKSGAPLYKTPNRKCEILTALHINDMFLMNIHDVDHPLEELTIDFLSQHLYRVQKLSSHFYEFRQAFNNHLDSTEYPNYIRINNFGSKKTGWLTYNPIKVEISPIGEITYAKEKYVSKRKKVIL